MDAARGPSDSGFCGEGETGCGQTRHTPTVGPGNVLHVLHDAPSASLGGAVVALEPDGTTREGCPVTLNRVGAGFWSIVTDADNVSYALAIGPEGSGAFSGTIIATAPDSTVRYSTTVVEP